MNLDQININIKERIIELRNIIYNDYNCAGGELHIVLDDKNLDDYFIKWCIDNSIPKIKDNKEKQIYFECANLLLKLSYSSRYKLIAKKH